MIVDVSTAVVAEGKVQVALAEGREMPPGCIVDSQGEPTTDPARYFAGGGLIPLGGLVADHKGFGLGLAAALVRVARHDRGRPAFAGGRTGRPRVRPLAAEWPV